MHACGLAARPAVVVGTVGVAPANLSSASGWHSRRTGQSTLGRQCFILPMTRSDFGDDLGLSVQSVSRTFTTIKMRGLIELPRADHAKYVDIGSFRVLRMATPTPK